MARYYDEPIQMVCDGDGAPIRFVWREDAYQVLALLARWHLRDRWWATETEAEGAPAAAPAAGRSGVSPAYRLHLPATDRFYWRLHCASEQTAMVFCVVYHDAAAPTAAAQWRLERVYD